jgi:hypothetical protein
MNFQYPINAARTLLAGVAFFGVQFEGRAQDSAAPTATTEVSATALKAVEAASKEPSKATTPSTAVAATANGAAAVVEPIVFPGKTDLDEPGLSDPRLLVPVDAEGKVMVGKLSKIDLDADLDYDGTLDNASSTDGGQLEFMPPGLELGEGEVTRVVVRFKTYEKDFPGALIAAIEVEGVNRDSTSGLFEGASESSVGRIRVWRDQARKELLVDSGDASKRRFEWRFDPEKRSGGIPRTLYVEGVKASPKFEGDLRLLLSAVQVAEGGDPKTPSSLYQAAFDHVLFTVRDKPVEKEFINNNVEGVWSTTSSPAKSEEPPVEEKPKAE